MRSNIILLFLFPLVLFAQYDDEKEILDQLTGDAYKLWFFDRYEVNMGSNETCEEGKSYTFHRSMKVSVKECINESWTTNEYEFSLEKESQFDWWITFNEGRYYLVIRHKGAFMEAKLRTRLSLHDKTDESQDIILKHYIDD